MTIKDLKQVMDRTYQEDEGSYSDLFEAVLVLWNLGLVDSKLYDAMIKEDERLFSACYDITASKP